MAFIDFQTKLLQSTNCTSSSLYALSIPSFICGVFVCMCGSVLGEVAENLSGYFWERNIFSKMGPLKLLLSCILMAGAASHPDIQVNKPEADPSIVYWGVHHGLGANSSVDAESVLSFLDVLTRDENRIKALTHRITRGGKSHSGISNRTTGFLGPKAVSTPVSSGLSIGSGNYYVKAGLGSPVKYYSMILDTGSSLSWLQCEPCIIACHVQVDPVFNPSSSATYKFLSCSTSQCSNLREATLNDPLCEARTGKCVYTATYGDSSFSVGYLSQDFLSLTPSETLPDFVYGCGQDNQGLFGKSAGIIGLARQKLSLLSQLSPRYGNAFSYCLPTATSVGHGGYLAIGKASLAVSTYKFTPMITNPREPSLYFLRFGGITIDGKTVGVSAGAYHVPTIIDSGTVITRLPETVYTALKQAFVKVMLTKYTQAASFSILDTCFKGSVTSLSVPQIKMVFQGGAVLALNPRNILVDVDGGRTCLAFAGGSQVAVIGNYQQQTFSVAYDVFNSRIGFAAGGCV